MISDKYVYCGITYAIEVKDLYIGTMGESPLWQVIVSDPHNAQVVNASLDGNLASFIKIHWGQDAETFLCTFAKSEVQRLRGNQK